MKDKLEILKDWVNAELIDVQPRKWSPDSEYYYESGQEVAYERTLDKIEELLYR